MRFKQFLLFLFLILIPLLIGAYSPQTVRVGRDLASSFFQPFFEVTHRANSWILSKKYFFEQIFKVQKENERLLEKNRFLEKELSALQETRGENLRLKKLVGFRETSEWKSISAQVIARDLSHWSYYAMINKGSLDGIQPEMPVVTGEGLIGKVTSVGPYSSRVILLIDNESRVSALVQETRDVGLIEGTGGPLLKMTYLELSAKVQVGQNVISSGFGGTYPKGIPIGEIIQIGEERNQLGLYAIVKPYTSFSKLEEVLCLKIAKQREPESL